MDQGQRSVGCGSPAAGWCPSGGQVVPPAAALASGMGVVMGRAKNCAGAKATATRQQRRAAGFQLQRPGCGTEKLKTCESD